MIIVKMNYQDHLMQVEGKETNMKNLINKKPVKITLITLIVLVFLVSLCPLYLPIVEPIRLMIGSFMIGWWTGRCIMKIWYK